MRHSKRVDLLAKPADQRKALLRALTTEIIRHGRIKTTLVRAKAVKKHVEHMISLGKRGDLHARRQVHCRVDCKRPEEEDHARRETCVSGNKMGLKN